MEPSELPCAIASKVSAVLCFVLFAESSRSARNGRRFDDKLVAILILF